MIEAINDSSDIFVQVSDLDDTSETEHDLPVYYSSEGKRMVYPLELSTYALKKIDELLNEDIRRNNFRGFSIEIPTDEDPARYWESQLVYLIDYEHNYRHRDVFGVYSVDLSYDENYDIDSYVVNVMPVLGSKDN